MPYKFTFDLSSVPRFFFTELTMLSYQKGMHKTFLKTANDLIVKFRIQEATGLNISDAVVLLAGSPRPASSQLDAERQIS